MSGGNMNYELAQDRSPKIFAAHDGDHLAGPHFHKKLELIYNLTDTKVVNVGNREYTLLPDNFLIVDSYQLHFYQPSAGEQMLLILPIVYCEHYFQYRKNKILRSSVVDDPAFCRERIYPYFRRVAEHFEKMDLFCVQANVDMILSAACEKIGLDANVHYTLEGVDAILAYIEQNYDKDLTLPHLADHFGYSKYYFSRMFNEMFHTSLNDYLSVTRLQHTFRYYAEHDCSITTAALNCGFGSMPTFYRVLKKNHGELSLRNMKKNEEL